ncbi:energy transducer TonB [Novosphingobium album (ex Liu et al. 2023)]|uniref:TonB family protein n=1 Tax=Novosphingobium album (ex Liu et al. 2023) TaxID=3031130 RepID=A0ABT5WSZ8_9SPHN|nr:energy transducer TonB [Novosphingobium album (ex Liu et al. 2023)]MDE8653115.1 TonB family protein [Novosphingobium album (ex Liu et al. 2023)]
MSYADRTTTHSSSRTIVFATVAGIHALVLYGLVTGLGGAYIERVATVFRTTNYPVDPPSPPPTAEPEQKMPNQADTVITTPRAPIPLPDTGQRPYFEQPPFALPQSGPGDDEVVVLPELKPTPLPSGKPTPARPRNAPASWVTTDDYPTRELRDGVEGVVGFELTIGADGKVEGCRVTNSSGSPGLDAATCKYVRRQARFEPATDANGTKVPGTYASRVNWVIPKD